jgi:uncharacterized protein YqgV (UPF0045/DUF77 family)
VEKGGLMPRMKITIPPLDKKNRSTGDLMTSFILLSKEKGARCQLVSPNRATVEGNKETLLEILDEFGGVSFGPMVKDAVIAVEFDEEDDIPSTQGEIRPLERKVTSETEPQVHKGKTRTDRRDLHDMVLKRLDRYADRRD